MTFSLPTLNEQGMYAQRYADDIAVVIRGNRMVKCLTTLIGREGIDH